MPQQPTYSKDELIALINDADSETLSIIEKLWDEEFHLYYCLDNRDILRKIEIQHFKIYYQQQKSIRYKGNENTN